jgi:hypothetical protein
VNSAQGPGEFNDAQRSALDARRADQDRTLAAIQHLEAMLSSAAPGREQAWQAEVASALASLDEAVAEEAANADQPDSLLSDMARTQPWLRNRVRGLRLGYRQLRDSLKSLRAELEGNTEVHVDYADVRQRLGWVLGGLRHQRARESDLIYEAYYDAFRADLAADAGSGTGPE